MGAAAAAQSMSASLIGRLGSSAFRLSTTTVSMSLTGSCFSSESAPGPFHHGIRGRGGTIFWAALPSDDGRSKRTCELTSSIVPRGTSFHRSVELEFPPIGFDAARFSCCCCGSAPGFSNRPFGVKRFQTIHHYSVDVAHGLVLLFGIGTKALPSWDSRTRRNNLWAALPSDVTAGPSGHANSPHPSSREGHHSTARWSSSVLLLD